MKKKKEESYALTPIGVCLAYHCDEKILDYLYLIALKQGYNAIIFEKGKAEWGKVEKK